MDISNHPIDEEPVKSDYPKACIQAIVTMLCKEFIDLKTTQKPTDSSPNMPWPKALLFDLDLTLIRSRSFWRHAEQVLLGYLGFDEQMDVHHCYNGLHATDAGKAIHALLKPTASEDECVRVFREALIEQFATQPIEAMPGAVDLVHRYAGRLPMAIASGSPQEGIHAAAVALGIHGTLDAAISSESVANGKPAPDVFVKAARELDVAVEDCVVFEDSVVGATAAVRAGMQCIVVPDQPESAFAGLPVHLVKSLADVDEDLFAMTRR